jgi:putative transcriptional regulator
MSKTTITARMHKNGMLVEQLSDGSEKPFLEQPMRDMTVEEIKTAAHSDPDALPMSAEQLKNARQVPRVRTMRRALQLTQEEFSARYHIPLGTLRDWEQGRSVPDQTARAYLTAIAAAPETIKQALQT